MNVNDDSRGKCGKCGAAVVADQLLCSRCIIEQAEEDLARSSEESRLSITPPSSKPSKKRALRVIVLLVSLVILAFQMPALFAAFQEIQPLRQGSFETDAITDQCIANLWRAARILQDGGMPGNDLFCPASGDSYVLVRSGGDIRAYCPNPELHGFSEISVSRNLPRPEVKQ